jgi:hypothetical protein
VIAEQRKTQLALDDICLIESAVKSVFKVLAAQRKTQFELDDIRFIESCRITRIKEITRISGNPQNYHNNFASDKNHRLLLRVIFNIHIPEWQKRMSFDVKELYEVCKRQGHFY